MKKVKKTQQFIRFLSNFEANLDDLVHQNVVVGVSGGADSLCLLHILHRKGIKTIAVYVNHGLREEAAADGLHVQTLCEQWEIPFHSVLINVQEFSQDNKIPLEEASRILRYGKLFEIAETEHACAVAVAHHADDQVETVMMHLIRGSGLSGLRGMSEITHQHSWHASIPLIRPLLSMWKDEINQYCDENQIPVVLDESNFDTTFFRNRLRHDLIPELTTYNPNFKEGLLRMSGILQDDYSLLSGLLEDSIKELQVQILENQITFLHSNYLNLHTSLQRMVLRDLISHLSPDLRDVDFAAIERANQLIISATPDKQIDLVDRLVLFLDEKLVVIKRKVSPYRRPDIPLMVDHEKIIVKIGEKIPLSEQWFFRMNLLDHLPEVGNENKNGLTVFVDANKCGEQLFLKTITAGDRFSPCGLKGHSQKVSDVFTNMKVSRWIRNLYPLVCDEQDILWIPGQRIAEKVKMDSSTVQYYQMSFFQE